MRLLTKEQMVRALAGLKDRGWIPSIRPANAGGIGNTIDGLLGLPENNLPIQDTAQWELKSHRVGSSSLLTLFHMEPQPTARKVVPSILLPLYGWPDRSGRPDEQSFRQTLNAAQFTDRGFRILVDRADERVLVEFDATRVADRHNEWLTTVRERVGLGPLDPQPYWDFQTLSLKASTKLLNAFYVGVETKRESGQELFKIVDLVVLQGFDSDKFIDAIDVGDALIDFDARTRHNHGTKFRLRQDATPGLYRYVERPL
jgi:hypothetical protein